MKKLKFKRPQIEMGLKYSGSSLLGAVHFRLKKFSTLFNQFIFWRSPLLWFIVFVNASATTFLTTWIYANMDKLPSEITFHYYLFEQSAKFITITDTINKIFVHIFIQFVTLIIASRISPRFRQLSTFILVCSAITSLAFFLALYKALSLVVI